MPRFYATFGVGQRYAGFYVEIHAEDHHAARIFMIDAHAHRWSELYDEARFAGQVERHDLWKLATVRQLPGGDGEEVSFEVVRENHRARH